MHCGPPNQSFGGAMAPVAAPPMFYDRMQAACVPSVARLYVAVTLCFKLRSFFTLIFAFFKH